MTTSNGANNLPYFEQTMTSIDHEGGYFLQYKALLIRNLIIKKQEKRKSLTEFLMPLYFIFILAILRMMIKDTTYEAIASPHDGDYLQMNQIPIVSGDLFITPDNEKVKDFMNHLAKVVNISSNQVTYYSTEKDILDAYSNNSHKLSVALVFNDDPLNNSSYTIRINPKKFYLVSPSTMLTPESKCRMTLITGLENGYSCPPNSYYETGFLSLQSAVDYTIINQTTILDSIYVPYPFFQSFPRNEYISGGTMTLRSIVPLYMVFAWAQFIIYMMILIVEEKEKKIKEGMKMMGLRGSVYWLSWVTIYSIYVVLLAVICIIVLPLSNVFRYANLLLLFILFVLYGLSSIILALMLTPFFNKAKVAGIVGQLIQVGMSLLFYLQVYLGDKISPATFWALGLLSPCAFSLAIDKVILFDFSAGGLNWNNVWDGNGLPFAGSLIMISIDIVIYLALAFYLDNVIPSEYGVKEKPWFIFQKSTWIKRKNYSKDIQGQLNALFESNYADGNMDIEPLPIELHGKEAVRIRNLNKIFKSGKEIVHAVNDISMDIYEGQITAILGHNGAGKTTLFNLLTGMISPTGGSVSIFNYDLSSQREIGKIRKLTGVCPQHNILFVNLTAREHLQFYARIKGIPTLEVEEKVEEMLDDIDLKSKADTKSSDLSGGQQRKLSIGIALIGDPKIIFLDEPTAGVDAYSRRHLWNLLAKKKHGKVILLTTHFMDEADILADRKAIISRGKLRCYGTSLFLKNKFGLGYHLTLVVSEHNSEASIKKLIKTVIPAAELSRHYGKEVSFLLPTASTPLFPLLFDKLEKSSTSKIPLENLIESYGISMTTLEEVFLLLSEEKETEDIDNIEDLTKFLIKARSSSIHSSARSNSDHHSPESEEMILHSHTQQGFTFQDVHIEKSTWRTFSALCKLRFLNLRREWKAVVSLIILPLVFVIISIALANGMRIKIADSEIINLNPGLYSTDVNKVLIYNGTNQTLGVLEDVLTDFGLFAEPYNGSYQYIYDNQPHFSSFDIISNSSIAQYVDETVLYNSSLTHILPILNNIISNTLLRSLNKSAGKIEISSQQLPLLGDGEVTLDIASFFSPIMIGFVFTLIPAGLVIDIVYDREIKARNLLRLNGVGFNVYFASFFISIGFLYFISYINLLVIIQAFQVPSLVQPIAYATLALLYLIYMPPALLFSGCVSYLFDKQETARQFYPSIVSTLGFVCYTIVIVVDMFNSTKASIIHLVFTFFIPYYIPFGALYYVNKVYMLCSLTNKCDQLTISDYLTEEIIIMYVACAIGTCLFCILLRVIDTIKLGGSIKDALWIKMKTEVTVEEAIDFDPNEDIDIKEERDRVLQNLKAPSWTPLALLYNLGKTYKKGDEKQKLCDCKKKTNSQFTAVKSISLEVRPGEVFGLLGPNGAGKTTTLQIMTAEEQPTKGQVKICGHSITSSLSSAFKHLGYCPQHDCLWKNITVAEHINCFAEIRGVQKDEVENLVKMYLDGLEIDSHSMKKSRDCSGGTKRKLCYILSMMGSPQMVLLDEPSTGMDPQSKRFLWNSILASFKTNRSAILTTHSMEEAEALCSRIGIMVRGELRCLGTVQHLKNKFGSGYSLEIKLKNVDGSLGELPIERLKSLISSQIPDSIIEEEFDARVLFKMPQDQRSLGSIFDIMENLKGSGVVEEYALTQTTLEQVFIKFARQQEEEEEDEK